MRRTPNSDVTDSGGARSRDPACREGRGQGSRLSRPTRRSTTFFRRGATIHSIIAPLRIVLEEEVHAGRLAVNPAKGLRMPAADASATASRRPSRRFASWMRFGIVTARCGDGDLRGPALR